MPDTNQKSDVSKLSDCLIAQHATGRMIERDAKPSSVRGVQTPLIEGGSEEGEEIANEPIEAALFEYWAQKDPVPPIGRERKADRLILSEAVTAVFPSSNVLQKHPKTELTLIGLLIHWANVKRIADEAHEHEAWLQRVFWLAGE